jgi:diguanylate cyclase (GGDEF)-like protein
MTPVFGNQTQAPEGTTSHLDVAQTVFVTRVIAPVAAAIFAILALLIVALMVAAKVQDDAALVREQGMAQTQIAKSLKQTEREMLAYANWDDTLQYAVLAPNSNWVNAQLGETMYSDFGYPIALVVRNGRVMFGYKNGQPILSPHQQLGTDLKPLLSAIARAPGASGQSGLIRWQGRTALVSALVITSDSGSLAQPKGAPGWLIALRWPDEKTLASIAESSGLQGLALAPATATPASGAIGLSTLDGQPAAQLIWQSERPGSRLVLQSSPFLALAAVFILCATTFFLSRARGTVAKTAMDQARVRYLAWHDPLTSLPNRTAFSEQLARAAKDATAKRPIAILFFDLDLFKQVNDAYGHPTGDELLRQVAMRLKRLGKTVDCIARLGGDEFAVLMRGTDLPESAIALGRMIQQMLSQPFLIGGRALRIGSTIGVSVAPEHGDDPHVLLRRADIALYVAKDMGRGSLQVFKPDMENEAQNRRQLAQDLERAIQRREINVVYQPQVDSLTRKLVGVEALARWNHPEKGAISPGLFVPLAEETGQIPALGALILEVACFDARRWPDLTVSVNLSPAQLRDPQLISRVDRALRLSGLPTSRLELEITEGVLLQQTPEVQDAIDQLRQRQIRFALDDFGTGYSSLSYLRKLPVDKIKIDQSFVRTLEGDRDQAAIVRTIIQLAKALRKTVTAEGVETEGQAAILAAEQCNYLQGYLTGRPQSADQIDERLATDRAAEQPQALSA